jgi:type I restriction enzyme S subunit
LSAQSKYLLSTQRTITTAGYKSCNTHLVKPGNLIISNRAPIGLIAINKVPVCTNQGCKAIEVDSKKVNVGYLYYYLLASVKELNNLGTGTTFMEISSDSLKNFPVPLTNLEHQQSLVNFLENKTQTIDKMIAAKHSLYESLEEAKRALIFQIITKGIKQDSSLIDSGQVWLGKVPAYWHRTYLMGVAHELKQKNSPGNLPTLLSLSYGKIIEKDIHDNGGLLPNSFDTYQLVTRGQTILRLTDLQNDHRSLRVGYVEQSGMITSAYSCVTPRPNIYSRYLYYYLHAADLRKVFYSMGGGVRQSMKFNNLKRLVMFVPPTIQEQQQIVEYIDTQIKKVDAIQQKTKRSIRLLEEYRTSLISNVITGKLNVENLKQEPKSHYELQRNSV